MVALPGVGRCERAKQRDDSIIIANNTPVGGEPSVLCRESYERLYESTDGVVTATRRRLRADRFLPP